MFNSSVTCPGEAVQYTCSSPGTLLSWQVDLPPAGPNMKSLNSFFLSSQVHVRRALTSGEITFEAVFNSDGVNLMSTLINLSEVSVLDGSNVTCTVTNSGVLSQQQTIMVAGEYFLHS